MASSNFDILKGSSMLPSNIATAVAGARKRKTQEMLVLSEKKVNENPKTSQGFRGNKFLNGGAGAMSSSPKGQYQPFPHHGNDNQMSIKSKQHKRFGSKLSDLTFDSKLLPSFCKSI